MFENSFGKILKSAFKILNNKKLKVFPQRKKTKKKKLLQFTLHGGGHQSIHARLS
jgi:hypothetical protein